MRLVAKPDVCALPGCGVALRRTVYLYQCPDATDAGVKSLHLLRLTLHAFNYIFFGCDLEYYHLT